MTILTKPSLTAKKIPLYCETTETDELTADGFVAKNTTIDTEKCMRVDNSFNPALINASNGRNADPLRKNQQKKKRFCLCACGCGFNVGAKKVKKVKVIEISVIPGPCKRRSVAILCLSVTVFLLVLMGLITAMQYYELVNTEASQRNRYQGFCSIPLPRDMQMLESRKMPLRWKTAPDNVGRLEPNIQVVSLMDEDPEHLFDLLREVLDINIDESVEKISVFNNGHPVSFIHDFESNVTGIVDSERCFTMDMDPSLVLQPELFLLGLQRGDEFDVSRVRSQLRALLPPLSADSAASADSADSAHSAALHSCAGKPTYRLQKDAGLVIRKRSADAPPHDYMQFAGARVQEIEICNLAELLQFEQDVRLH